VIRVLHNLSFIEDPTRVLRAARFEQRFGFKIEPRTARLIGDALAMFARVSDARIRHEFDLIFREREPEKALARANELGAFKAIMAQLDFTDWHAGKFRQARVVEEQPTALTYLGLLAYHLTPSLAAEFCARLRLTNAEDETIMQLLALRAESEPRLAAAALAPSALYHLLAEYSDGALALFTLATDDERVRECVTLFRTRLRGIAPELTGHDLKRMGIRPGPQYRAILERLRDARLDGEISTREQEIEIVNSQQSTVDSQR
jgi:tRNA nucleotidyltransferase (CCA-adding enzyme)